MTNRSALLLFFSCLVLLTVPSKCLPLDVEQVEIEVNGNPHIEKRNNDAESCNQSSCQPQLLLEPYRIIQTPMSNLQPDTLIEIKTAKVLSVPVPVYHFKQPARISEKELPFQLVLVSDIGTKNGLHEISVHPSKAADSWFVGYQWSPIVCEKCGEYVHVGWKFTSGTDFFYALIVDVNERKRETEGIAIGTLGELLVAGVRAPGWMVSALPM